MSVFLCVAVHATDSIQYTKLVQWTGYTKYWGWTRSEQQSSSYSCRKKDVLNVKTQIFWWARTNQKSINRKWITSKRILCGPHISRLVHFQCSPRVCCKRLTCHQCCSNIISTLLLILGILQIFFVRYNLRTRMLFWQNFGTPALSQWGAAQ